MPNSIGHQDLAALIARQPAVTERWRAHVRNSTFGTIHAASLSLPRLVGASIPDPFFTQLAALDPRALEATGSIPLSVPIEPVVTPPVYDFPVVDRRLKGDRLNVGAPPTSPEPARREPSSPARTKDQASLPPSSAPIPREAAQPGRDEIASRPSLPKGDRLAPAPTYHRFGIAPGQVTPAKRLLGTGPRRPIVVATPAEPAADPILRRAGIAAGQSTLAKRELGSGPRNPIVVANPAEPAANPILRRAGIAAGQSTLAKRELGSGPRKPIVVATPAEPAADPILRRAGIAAGQSTLAKRELGSGPRNPIVVAAPAEPAADPILRRAGIAAGQSTLAKRNLGSGPRNPIVIAAPAERESGTLSRRPGLAAAHLRKLRDEAKFIRTPTAETADLESARADREGRIVAKRPSLAETADLESARADLAGPLAAPAPVAETAQQSAPEIADLATLPEPAAQVPEPAPEVADLAPAPNNEVSDKALEPEAVAAVPVERPASASAMAEVQPAMAPKTSDRFNTQAVEQLSQYANPGAQTRVFFGTRELGIGRSRWEAWEPDEIPTLLAPPHVDTEIKRAALDPVPDAGSEKPGETIAPKGEVTGEGKRPRTPAERLSLAGASRVKHEKCLANAIYFEARGEVERGQMAVAQVILNRAFSGYYPGNVCDVVYQNAHRHLACQFTFACDNHKDVVRDLPRWEIATRIAADALDGKFWLPEIGKATHYHATYVNPWWVRTMTKHTRLGVHIFYRPTRWGSLDEIPVWGDRLEVTGTIKRDASPASPGKGNDEKRADAQPAAPARRSIFDPVEPITPGG